MLFALISLKPMSIVCQIIALWACLKVVLLPSFHPGTGCNLSWDFLNASHLLSNVVIIVVSSCCHNYKGAIKHNNHHTKENISLHIILIPGAQLT